MEDTWAIVTSLQVPLGGSAPIRSVAPPLEPEPEQRTTRPLKLPVSQVPLPPSALRLSSSSRGDGDGDGSHGEPLSPASSIVSMRSSGSLTSLSGCLTDLNADSCTCETGSSPVTPAGSPPSPDGAGGLSIRGLTHSKWVDGLLDEFPTKLEPSPEARQTSHALAAPVERSKTCSDVVAEANPLDPGGLFFGAVYDGHGGKECSDFLRERMHVNLAREIAFGADPRLASDDPRRTRHIHDAMLSAYLMTDMHCRKAGITSGSTSVTTVINRDSEGRRWAHVANAGDAAAIVCRQCPMEGLCKREHRGAEAIRLSATHRPCVPSERERVTGVGGFILRERVLGVLAVTRAMGNHGLKSGQTGLIARPSCKSMELQSDDRFLVLASDGLTDVLSDQTIVDIVCSGVHKMRSASVKRGKPVKHAATTLSKLLIHKAMQHGACDNITAMVIIL